MKNTIFRIMSFNVRYDSQSDDYHSWKNRRERVSRLIQFYDPDIIGFQETFKHQLEYLNNQLPSYNWIGVGREDGRESGEFSPIFFKRNRLKLLQQDSFWLSEQPEIPGSIGWDAKYSRLVTCCILKEAKLNDKFSIFNTHLDHDGETARIQSTKLIMKKIKNYASDIPAIITGDLNTLPESEPYRILLSDQRFRLRDAFHHSHYPHYGPDYTFNGFGMRATQGRIDYILATEHWKIWRSAIVPEFWNNFYSSDHFPVIADISLKNVEHIKDTHKNQ
ncbi:MAG: endonuclease/exonuclease/phosphatase family protein [Calditrichaeota bacterium]|nr:endonuclease/exonuclease/phosphatase family protein [Calditrichota bacterium]